MNRPAIFITGAPRSGTTWVGRTLATAKKTIYIHEPFNCHSPWNGCILTPTRFIYLNDANGGIYEPSVRRLLELDPTFPQPWAEGPRSRAKQQIDTAIENWGSRETLVPIVKDPLGVFTVEWMAAVFGVTPVVVLRHPISIAKSFVDLGWSPNVTIRFLRLQPELGLEYLGDAEVTRLFASADAAESGLEMTCIFVRSVVLILAEYYRRHPDWIWISHEELMDNPVEGFAALFDELALETSVATGEALSRNERYGPRTGDADSAGDAFVPKSEAAHNDVEREQWQLAWEKYFADIGALFGGLVSWDPP